MANTLKRWLISIPGAILVTLGLFFLMIILIQTGDVLLEEKEEYAQIEINPIIDDYTPATRQTKIDTIEKVKPPPPPPRIQKPRADKPNEDLGASLAGAIPDFEKPEINKSDTGNIEIVDRDEQPLVRIPPVYPPRAAERGTEGQCTAYFDIGTNGVPFNITAKCTSSVFERAVIKAVQKWKYRPRIRDGKPIIRKGWQTEIPFRLEGD